MCGRWQYSGAIRSSSAECQRRRDVWQLPALAQTARGSGSLSTRGRRFDRQRCYTTPRAQEVSSASTTDEWGYSRASAGCAVTVRMASFARRAALPVWHSLSLSPIVLVLQATNAQLPFTVVAEAEKLSPSCHCQCVVVACKNSSTGTSMHTEDICPGVGSAGCRAGSGQRTQEL